MTVAGQAQVSDLCNRSRPPRFGSYTNTYGVHGASCHVGLQETQLQLPEGASMLSDMAFFLEIPLSPQHSWAHMLRGTRFLTSELMKKNPHDYIMINILLLQMGKLRSQREKETVWPMRLDNGKGGN